ncbi:hypothetical protein CBR_g25984 [Chara braunii]|uniref:DUF659 domain-containing protein n=1 Tax=Chara braunii TaxID=69332 RepID=A0A388L6Z6_CHABU|nr:hypothetical protein CBR_g25984 [Chara braunii]|eukprot:GBG78048.1 hypothetical protein CBR_g25984 [Chara braunii]
MECKLCGRGFQGSQSKAAQHFRIKNNCSKVIEEQLAEIWNKTNYSFDHSHHRKILDFLRSRGFRDNRNTSGKEQAGEDEYDDSEDERRATEGGGGDSDSDSRDIEVRREAERARGKMRGDKAVDEDSTPDEHDDNDDDNDDDDDHEGADIGASLAGGLMAAGRRGQEGAAKAMKEAAQSTKRKRKATTPAPPLPKKGKALQQTSMLEAFDPAWQREFSNEFLQWWYVSGIPFEAARRPEYQRVRKRLLECPPYTHPALPTHRVISGDDIPEQQRVVAEMVAAVRKDIAATGATILTDGRKIVQRDGAVQETVEVVVERWNDVFDKFGVENVNAICTDSASAYVAASKLLAKEEVKYSRITWLPCAVHVCNLLLSDIAKDDTPGKLGKREDTIIRARAVVRFIREHGAALSLYRCFSASHPSSASTVAASSSAAPPSSQRRGRELVYPAQTRFVTHYLMLERLLDRRPALESMMMSDDWLRTVWRRSIFLQERWVHHQVRYAPFWEHMEDIVELMTPVMQLLRRLDRGGRVMTRMWSWALAMIDRVARAILNRTWMEDLNIVVQTGGDEELYQTLRTQLAEFLSRKGDWTYGGVQGDRDAASCRGEKETLQVGQWWVQHGDGVPLLQNYAIRLTHTWTCASPAERNWAVHERVQVKKRNHLGFIKLARLVEISTNLRLSPCQGRGSGYVLPWEDAEEETEDSIPPPRDEGVRPADRVTEAQREWQVQRGRKDRLSKAPPSVETYFGRRATVLMPTELDAVYDPEPNPMAQDPIEAEPWSDPDDLAPLRSIPLPLHLRDRVVVLPLESMRSIPLHLQIDQDMASRGLDRLLRRDEATTTMMTERGTRAAVRTRMILPIPRHADVVTTTTTTTRAAMAHRLQVVCGGRIESVPTDAVVQAGRGGGGRARRESASSTRTVHLVDEGAATAEVDAGSRELGAALPEAAAEAAPSNAGSGAPFDEVAHEFAEVADEAAQVGSASAQLGASFSGMLDVSLGFPPTPAGERGSGDADAAATPVSQVLRDIPSCSMGDISSSMLQEAAAGTQGSSGQEECAPGDGGDCRSEQERAPESEQDRIDREEREMAQDLASRCHMTQSIASRARAQRLLETGGGEGHRATADSLLECGGAGGEEAGERPASPVQGVCVLPIGGAMTAGELERQAQEDPLRADRRGRMDEVSRRFMAEAPAYVLCSPSLPSSTTGATTSVHAEGATTAPGLAESPCPKSRKKKMRAGKSLSTVRRVMHAMRESQPGLAGLHPRTREALARDVVTDTVGWRERASTWATEQSMTTPVEAAMPRAEGRIASRGEEAEHSRPPGRSMVGRILGEDVRTVPAQRPSETTCVLESGTDDLQMPRGQRRRASMYDLLRAQHGVEAAPQGEVHAPGTAHRPVGGTGGGNDVTAVAMHRRRKEIMDNDDD